MQEEKKATPMAEGYKTREVRKILDCENTPVSPPRAIPAFYNRTSTKP